MIEKILKKNNFSSQQQDFIKKSFEFAKKAHEGQLRVSGEPFITHPLAVAEILSDLKLDSATIAAALLHDTIEDTAVTEEEIEKKFGKDVAFLVNGVTKLAKIEYKEQPEDRQNTYTKSLRKMFFAMAEDVRVILIKLADRYHNMETIAGLPPERRQKISLETLELYGPIAERLGMGHLKGDLEDMAFPYAYPKEHNWLMQKVKDKYADRIKYLEKIQPKIIRKLEENGVKITNAHSRAKHHYSLYKKVVKKEYDLNRIYDLVALRIILPTITDCYEALGVIHKSYKPIPGLIKDYIALPKLNGYQSIHTTIFCEKGKILEIQIRTPEMHEHAENGIAAHWSYGESGKNKLHTANLKEAEWIAQLKKWVENSSDEGFYKSLRTNFLNDRIFVFTPQGDIKELPEGSTPLDFAYAVHTDLGHATKGAKVNGKLMPLDYKLKNGEVVEILKTKTPKPSANWLRTIKSGEAKRKLQSWLKQKSINYSIPAEVKKTVAKKMETPATGLADLKDAPHRKLEIFANGHRDILSSTAKCCSPLPGQKILGYITKQKGISVHHAQCPNLEKLNPEKILEVSWPEKIDYYPLRVALTVKDKIGVLEEIGKITKNLKINILELKNSPPVDGLAEIKMTLALKNLDVTQKLFRKFEENKNIVKAKNSSLV